MGVAFVHYSSDLKTFSIMKSFFFPRFSKEPAYTPRGSCQIWKIGRFRFGKILAPPLTRLRVRKHLSTSLIGQSMGRWLERLLPTGLITIWNFIPNTYFRMFFIWNIPLSSNVEHMDYLFGSIRNYFSSIHIHLYFQSEWRWWTTSFSWLIILLLKIKGKLFATSVSFLFSFRR